MFLRFTRQKTAWANEDKASLMSSIRLLYPDIRNVNHPETVHDQQLGTLSDANEPNTNDFAHMPTKNSFLAQLVEETNSDEMICPACNTIQKTPWQNQCSQR